MRRLILAVLLATAVPAALAVPPVRMLLPIYFENSVPGAFGSIWQARFAIHNAGSSYYVIEWCSPADNSLCPLDLRADEELDPKETQTVLPARYPKPDNGASGAVIYLTPDDPAGDAVKDLSFQLRVTDISRSATNAGTAVPVVREAAFQISTINLLDIPADPRFRLVLRLFEMNLDRADFIVRTFDAATNAVVVQRQITTATAHQGRLRFRPAYIQVDDLFVGGGPSYARIEIEPLTKGCAFWAYVAITNNDSQQVTLVTPQ